MKKNSKKSILLLSIGGGLFICLISIYLSRNMLLQSITNKRTTHIEQTYGLQIHYQYLQPIITQYFIDNKSEIWLLFLIAHSKR